MSDVIVCDFVFVPNGASFPQDWVARHPDYITLPARFVGSPEFMARMFGKGRAREQHALDKSDNVRAINIMAGLDFGLDDPKLRVADTTLQPGVADPARIAAIGDLKCEGFASGCSTGGSRGTTGMYGISGRTLCTRCAIKILGIGNQSGREQLDTLMRYILPGQ